jgi:transcriptional regulator with XRE-family HTH domain
MDDVARETEAAMKREAEQVRACDSVSEKLDYLFSTVRRADGREFTYDDVERGTGGRVSRSYVWKLRHGRNRNPSLDVIEAVGEFFSVPPEYFFCNREEGARATEAAAVAALLHDQAARSVAERARGLSDTALQAVVALIDSLHTIESGRGRASSRNGARREPAKDRARSAGSAPGSGRNGPRSESTPGAG